MELDIKKEIDASLISENNGTKILLEGYPTLIVLDLNKVLQYRIFKHKKNNFETPLIVEDSVEKVDLGDRIIYLRPLYKEFLNFLFENYDVAIATSMNINNTKISLNALMTREQKERLIFVASNVEDKSRDSLVPPHYKSVLFLDDDPLKMRNNFRSDYYIVAPYDPSKAAYDNVLYTLIKLLPYLVSIKYEVKM